MAIEDENNYGLSGAQVKELAAQIKKRAVSVGEDGSSHVEEADQIYTKTLQLQEAGFIFRTTAGNLSVETGSADLLAIKGHTVQEGHRDAFVAVANIQTEATDASVVIEDEQQFLEQSSVSSQGEGNYYFRKTAGTNWRYENERGIGGTSNALGIRTTFGVSISGSFAEGDVVTLNFAEFALGTLTTATPTSFVATGYNQYDATAGYAHVIGGNQYRIAGTYTSIGIADEPGGTTTTLEVTNGKFTPEADGYVYVSGASGDILIALVWSGTRDSDPYEAFSKTTITIPTIDKESNSLPTATYGMPSVHDVADELNFADRLYIQRIGHYAYSAGNLATVEALGVDYWYDEEDIFYVLETPIKYKLADSVRGEYTANDFGTEEFVGTSVSVDAMLTYGNNLVDKLRNLLDIQSIGDKLELNGSELNVAQSALGDVVQVTGTSTTAVMSQDAVSKLLFPYGVKGGQIAIGNSTTNANGIALGTASSGASAVAFGRSAQALADGSFAVGRSANVPSGCTGGIALGTGGKVTRNGEINVGCRNRTGNGFNNTVYRLISDVYEGQDNHDAAIVAQGNKLMTAAPTTTDEGALGQLWTDTTNMHTYQCTAIDDTTDPDNPSYTWTQRW